MSRKCLDTKCVTKFEVIDYITSAKAKVGRSISTLDDEIIMKTFIN